jgi:hypothetical protein
MLDAEIGNRGQFAQLRQGMKRLSHPRFQGRRKPTCFPLAILEPRLPIAGFPMPSAPADCPAGIQSGFDVCFVGNLSEEDDFGAFGPFQDDGHPGGLAAGIKFDSQRLEGGLLSRTVLKADGERGHLVNHRSTMFEQLAGTFFGTGHERFFVLV